MKEYNGRCKVELASLTEAMKIQSALAKRAIPAEVIKLESSSAKKGCAYGLEFSCGQINNVRALLDGTGTRVKRWIND